jgi:hypothetical protein
MQRCFNSLSVAACVLALALGPTSPAGAWSIVVSDSGNGRIQQYAWPSGTLVRTFVPAGPLAAPPMGIRFGPNGNLYVAGYDADRVMEYDGRNGAVVGTFVPPGGSMNQPVGIAWAGPQQGVAPGYQGVYIMKLLGSPSGACADKYSLTGTSWEQLCTGTQWYPLFGQSVPLGATGAVYISWNNWQFPPSARVIKHTVSDGSPLQYYDDQITGPATGVAVMPDGRLLVADFGGDRVWRFDTSSPQQFAPNLGSFLGGGAYTLDGPRDIVYGPNGNLFVVGGLSNNVLEFNGTTGAFVRTVVPAGGGLSGPWGLAFGFTPGDLNGDGAVDQSDMGILLAAFGVGSGGDVDGDGDTDQSDLGLLLAFYGT